MASVKVVVGAVLLLVAAASLQGCGSAAQPAAAQPHAAQPHAAQLDADKAKQVAKQPETKQPSLAPSRVSDDTLPLQGAATVQEPKQQQTRRPEDTGAEESPVIKENAAKRQEEQEKPEKLAEAKQVAKQPETEQPSLAQSRVPDATLPLEGAATVQEPKQPQTRRPEDTRAEESPVIKENAATRQEEQEKLDELAEAKQVAKQPETEQPSLAPSRVPDATLPLEGAATVQEPKQPQTRRPEDTRAEEEATAAKRKAERRAEHKAAEHREDWAEEKRWGGRYWTPPEDRSWESIRGWGFAAETRYMAVGSAGFACGAGATLAAVFAFTRSRARQGDDGYAPLLV